MLIFFIVIFQAVGREPEEDALASFLEIPARVQSQNLEIQKAEKNLKDARENCILEKTIKEARAAVGGGYAYITPDPSSPGPQGNIFSGTAEVSVPITPQFRAGGNFSINSLGITKESISLKVSPFIPKAENIPEQEICEKAKVTLDYLKSSIFRRTENLIIRAAIQGMERDLAKETLALENRKYEVIRKQEEIGEASFQDVQEQVLSLKDAQQSVYQQELNYLNSRKELMLLLAPSEEEIVIPELSLEVLQFLITERKNTITGLQDQSITSQKLKNLGIEKRSLESEAKTAKKWQPDLTASSSLSLPETAFSISLEFSFSPADLKGEDLQDLYDEIKEKETDIAVEKFTAALEKDILKQSLAISEDALANAVLQKENDMLSFKEGGLLFEQGLRTVLQVEQLRLNLERSEIQCMKAAAEVLSLQGDLLDMWHL